MNYLILLIIFSSISLFLSLFVIFFIIYRKNLRLFDKLSLHLALADIFTTVPCLLSTHSYFEPSSVCHVQVYLHQFGMLNKAAITLTIALLVVYIVKTANLPSSNLHYCGYIFWSCLIILSVIILVYFDTASLYCDDHEDGHITELYHTKQREFLLYLAFYSIIVLICGIGSAAMLLYLYYQIISVWVVNESFHRSKLRFLIQRLKWYPIVFLASGLPQLLFVLIIVSTNKSPRILMILDPLSTPCLGISLSFVYIYWTLHNYYHQLFHENNPEITSFSSYYGVVRRPLHRSQSSSSPPLENDCFAKLIIKFLTLIRSYLISRRPTQQPIHDDLLSHNQINGGHTSSSDTSSGQLNILHNYHSDTSSTPQSSSQDLQSGNSDYRHPYQPPKISSSNEIQLTNSFSFKKPLQHSSDGSSRPSHLFNDQQQQEGGGGGGYSFSRYQPNRISLFDKSFIEQSILEDQNEMMISEEQTSTRPTDMGQHESISISFLMHLTGGGGGGGGIRQTNSNLSPSGINQTINGNNSNF